MVWRLRKDVRGRLAQPSVPKPPKPPKPPKAPEPPRPPKPPAPPGFQYYWVLDRKKTRKSKR
jgi:hypothetical protein